LVQQEINIFEIGDIMAKTVLIIDDSASLRQVVNFTLKAAGYTVVEAEHGQDALDKITSGVKPNLIICDVNMPVMNGIAFVTELKSLPDHQFIPVIMLTTEAGEDMKLQGQMAGCKSWLVKPFRPDIVLKAVQKLILP
jgi:two-component system chemotaxis response regulator CheY